MDTQLKIDEKPGKGIRRLLLTEMRGAMEKIGDDGEATKDGIHLFRKHCKRLRGLLRLARPVMGGDFEKEENLIRDLARELSGARDHVVMADTLCVLGVASSGEAGHAEAQITVKPDIDWVRRKLRKAISRMRERDFSRLDGRALWSAFSLTLKQLREEWKGICRKPSDKRFHRLRRWSNYYRHQLVALEQASPRKVQRTLKRLVKLIEATGKAHDLQMLRENLTPERELISLTRQIDEAELRRLETAFQVGARIFDLRHGALPRGMKKRVKSWGM